MRPLALEDRDLVTDYLRRYPPEVSELTFTNLFVWRKSRPVWIDEAEETILFLAQAHGRGGETKVALGPPAGRLSALSLMGMLGDDVAGYIRIPERVASTLREAGFCVASDRDNADYVYLVQDLASLEGRRFHKKRNLIGQCLKLHHCEYEEITPHLITECLEMQDRWCDDRSCGVNPGLCNEFEAIRETFAHYEVLGLIGGAIRVDGRIQAYALGEELAPGTAVCHFEKAMPQIQGLSQLINQWFAKNSLGSFTFVNREQDLGVPGLRQAKESYFPHHLVNKFSAFRVSGDPGRDLSLHTHECAKHGAGSEEGIGEQ